MKLSQLTQSRWFPTVTKPILSGLIAMGVVYGLRALGVTSVLPWEVNNAATPLVGLLVAAIAQKPLPADPAGPPDNGMPEPTGSIGSQMAQMVMDDLAQAIDSNPQLLKGVAVAMLTGKMKPPQIQAQVNLDGRKVAESTMPPPAGGQLRAVPPPPPEGVS